MTFVQFREALALGMIRNTRGVVTPAVTRSASAGATADDPMSETDDEDDEFDVCQRVSFHKAHGTALRVRCSVVGCGRHASFFCAKCSKTLGQGRVIAVCGPSTKSGEECFAAHTSATSKVRTLPSVES